MTLALSSPLKKMFCVLSLALLVVSCGKDEDETPKVISNFDTILQSTDRTQFVGQTVDVDDVSVGEITGTYIFWAGGKNSGIPVFRKDQLSGPTKAHVREGDRVRISGTVRKADLVKSADPMWQNITEEEKQDILNAHVFVEAENVQIIK